MKWNTKELIRPVRIDGVTGGGGSFKNSENSRLISFMFRLKSTKFIYEPDYWKLGESAVGYLGQLFTLNFSLVPSFN
jgi:hypothetical protein